jgi:RHS repeat-associated protein
MKQIQSVGSAAVTQAIRLIFTSALILAAAGLVRVEAQKSATAPANVAAGAPAGSYALTGFESVNLYSGNLNFNLPLVGVSGRGGVDIPFSLSVNNTDRWELSRPNTVINTSAQSAFSYKVDVVLIGGSVPPPSTMNSLFWNAHDEWNGYTFHFETGMMVPPGEPQQGDRPYRIEAGFLHPSDYPYVVQHPKIGYNPGLLLYRTSYQGGRLSDDPAKTVLGWSLTRLSFTTSNGTQYELRDLKTGGAAHDAKTNGNQVYSRGRVFVTADGSSATFVSDSDVTERFFFDPDNLRPDRPSGFLMLADGTRYRIDSGNVTWVRDRNGNLTGFSYDASNRVMSARDSAGHIFNVAYKGTTNPSTGATYDHDEISFKGTGGQPRTVKVWRGLLSNALAGGTTKTIHQLFPAWELDDTGDEVVNPDDVASAVELPDGRRYDLRYNAYGELARVVMPTGGKIEYDYLSIGSPAFVQRRVSERRLYPNSSDAAPELRQGFTYSINDGSLVHQDVQTVDVEQRAGVDGRLLSFEKHYFHGDISTLHKGLYTSWREGKEFKTETFDTDGTNPTGLLRRVESTLQPRQYAGFFPSAYRDGGPASDPRVVETVTTLENGLVSRQSAIDPQSPDPQNPNVGFDRFNNPTDSWEYDYHLPGEPESLLRHMRTVYVSDSSYTGGAWDFGSSPDAATLIGSPHMRGLPSLKSVYDAGGVERSRTTFEYDDYTPDPGTNNRHTPLVAYVDIFGLCTVFDAAGNCSNSSPASYTTRGNVTGTTSYLLDYGGNVTGSVTANQQYDIAGNVLKAVDARLRPDGGGYETLFDFHDRFGAPDVEARATSAPQELGGLRSYALLTSATNATGQTAYTQYDYYTGQAVNVEDINGTVSSVHYDDPLDRPTKAERAANVPALRAQTTFQYDDAGHTITTTSDQKSYGDNLIKGEVVYDGLGRTTESRQYETDAQYIAALARYDALGRVSEVSNPFRPTLGESPVWTQTTYDTLGRAWRVTTPDGAKVITRFDGPKTLVTDQSGKQRLSKTDALGRLSEVWEVRSADAAMGTEAVSFPHYADVPDVAAGYRTSYTYDVLGNLRKVEQGTQHRYFAYDSLKRLLRVRNPEQDVLGTLQLPAAMVSALSDNNNAWSLSYEYDENSNIKKRTDARGVSADYTYDALNRVINKDYSDSTPDVAYSFDGYTDAQGFHLITNARGQLTQVRSEGSSGITIYNYTAFDNVGRVTAASQTTDGVTYSMPEYKYDLAGNITSETYPSGRVVETQYDTAGRVAGIRKSAGDYYAGGDPSVANNLNVIAYAAHGGMAAERLGNGLWERTDYNNRFQPEHIRLGAAGAENSVLQLDYGYGGTGNNGNLTNQNITVPASGTQPGLAAAQVYSYDALNRLESAREVAGAAETWKQTYAYDRYGNRSLNASQTTLPKLTAPGQTAQPAVASPSMQATSNRFIEDQNGDGSKEYSYDKSGNLTCEARYCGPATTSPYYEYDAENRLKSVGGGPAAGGSSYVYDGGGRRVKKMTGTVVTVFVYDIKGRLAAEYGGGQTPQGGRSYLTQDHLGSTRVVTGQQGEVKGRYDYQPFGEELLAGRASQGYGTAGDMRQMFTGRERDGEINLDYFINRYYSPIQGRFTSYDPIFVNVKRLVDPQGLNLYAYSRNNPLKYIDPDGVDLLIAAKNEEDARKRYELLRKGLIPDDRQHTHFVVGDGKNGFAKGTFAVTVDKAYKSDSENFQTVQKIANAKDTEVLNVRGPKNEVTVLQAVTNRDGGTSVVRVGGVTFSHNTPGNPFAGYTFFPLITPPENLNFYSTSGNTESYIADDASDEELSADIHHELRHVLLGDFGRNIVRSYHRQPGQPETEADAATQRAEEEVKKNFKSP